MTQPESPPRSARILLISNGHGEDTIGALLAPHLQGHGFTVEGLAVVGDGAAYRRLGIPLIADTSRMPSGGFVYGRPVALAGDLASGLIGLTWRQIQAVRRERQRFDHVVAIGDVVVLAFAWLTGRNFSFVGCAKSDHYLAGRPGSYMWHERALLRLPTCRAVYPRDEITTNNLIRLNIAATYLGNPMLDGVAESLDAVPGTGAWPEGAGPRILILPGSRLEAYRNFLALAAGARAMRASAAGEIPTFVAAIAPGLEVAGFACGGWKVDGTPNRLTHDDGTVIQLVTGAFGMLARSASLALAMAGTATEQVVGLGKPVISLPGRGPQFTAAFAESQTRLLGSSVLLLPDDPQRVALEAWRLLGDPDRLAQISTNGRARMGTPGASARIAAALAKMQVTR